MKAQGPPVGRRKAEAGWWWRESGGPWQIPCWMGMLEGTEYAGAWQADCTCYPTGKTGRLSHLDADPMRKYRFIRGNAQISP